MTEPTIELGWQEAMIAAEREDAQSMSNPRIYLHPDGQTVSIGFDDTNDTLLHLGRGDNWRDADRLRVWVDVVKRTLDETERLRALDKDHSGGGS